MGSDHVEVLQRMMQTCVDSVMDRTPEIFALKAAIAALSRPAGGEWVMAPRWKIERAAEVVERDGDEHGVGADLRGMLAAAPAPTSKEDVMESFGRMPAPIPNPDAYPENYADGFNEACTLMLEAMPTEARELFSMAGAAASTPHGGEDDRILWGVVANAGRLSADRKPRWAHVVDTTARGSTSSADLCRRFGFDPDENVGGAAAIAASREVGDG